MGSRIGSISFEIASLACTFTIQNLVTERISKMYTTLILVISCVILYFLYDKWCRTYFWRLGIPSPSSIPVFGNFTEWFVVFHDRFAEYFETHGKIVGVYNFRKPMLLVSDADVLKNILVKDFDHFENREKGSLSKGTLDEGLLGTRDERWRNVRNLLSPSFNSVKIKAMVPLMSDCAQILVDILGREGSNGKSVECKELYGAFAMDVIGSCAFGLRVNSQTNKEEPFVQYAKKLHTFSATNPIFLIVMLFPWTAPILRYFRMGAFPKDIEDFFLQMFDKAIEKRQADGDSETSDFLQLMLSAHKESDAAQPLIKDDLTDLAQNTNLMKTRVKTALNRQEILGNSMTFFLAGYETTSTALGFVSFMLATNQEVQERLIEEVLSAAPTPNYVTYDTISNMEYLNMVVMETLRMYPSGEVLERVCNKEITYNGIRIKTGQHIFIPIWNLHYDPDLWPDPKTFDPERFSKERRSNNHPYGWLPFGMGPRSCIGARFAILEIKVAVISILQKYRFDIAPETEIPPKLGNLGFLTPPNGITLRIRPL